MQPTNTGRTTCASPSPQEIRDLRMRSGLTQSEAAAMVCSSRRSWQQWEAADAAMHPALWDLFQIRVGAGRVKLSAADVQWIVNDNAELGVKIGEQFFFLYKGDSLQYPTGRHDDDTPMLWRPVGKREFGECCHPVKFWKDGARLPRRYTDELDFIPGLSFGKPEDAAWRELPQEGGAA